MSRPEFARRAGGSFFAFLAAAILVPLGLGGVTLRLRTGRVVLLVLAAVLVVLFLLGAVNAALNAPG